MIFEEISKFGTHGRTGVLYTRRGIVKTPTFMPDGTRGAVKSLTPEQVVGTGVEVVLANTYHLHLNPGEKVIKKLGGLHAFANRKGPMLTDSGGFQVFSLNSHVKITEEGVHFTDPKTGDKHFISPEISMQIQLDLGADMIVAFDHLVGLDESVTDDDVKDAFDRTHRWLNRCIVEFKRLTKDMDEPGPSDLDARADLSVSNGTSRTEKYGEASSHSGKSGIAPKPTASIDDKVGEQSSGVRRQRRPLLFGVVQGGLDIELRKESLRIIQESEVDGIAIGGLSVGETREEMTTILAALAPLYDGKRPRFLLGVGTPEDLRIAVEYGIDMLDCVLPTRNARHGVVWGHKTCNCTTSPNQVGADSASRPSSADISAQSSRTVPDVQFAAVEQKIDQISLECKLCGASLIERIHLTNEKYKEDSSVIEIDCDCYACVNGFSKGFLRHQFKSGEPLAGTLASIHNLRYMIRICEGYTNGNE